MNQVYIKPHEVIQKIHTYVAMITKMSKYNISKTLVAS